MVPDETRGKYPPLTCAPVGAQQVERLRPYRGAEGGVRFTPGFIRHRVYVLHMYLFMCHAMSDFTRGYFPQRPRCGGRLAKLNSTVKLNLTVLQNEDPIDLSLMPNCAMVGPISL